MAGGGYETLEEPGPRFVFSNIGFLHALSKLIY